uniref:Methyltransferase domain-containing protein n=1 Tax=viral metagenome TaxID=1070528 RepID=A0A6C0HTF4_9ZZZZ
MESLWEKIVIILAVLLILANIFKYPKINEGFTIQHIEKTNKDIYDEFYSKIYDYLVFSNVRNEYEVGEIIQQTQPTENSVILDVGCGTGNVVNEFKKRGFNIFGVDQSQEMLNITKEKFSIEQLIKGDVLNRHLFYFNQFSHVLCLYFTVYYMKNKVLFFENVYDWLKPGGVFILHLVNREKFNPTLPMNTFERGKSKNITKIPFQDFDYEARFELIKEKNIGFFNEKFKTHSGGSRKHIHQFYMEDQLTILGLAQKIGFIVEGKIDMQKIKYDYQYLYILKKPY